MWIGRLLHILGWAVLGAGVLAVQANAQGATVSFHVGIEPVKVVHRGGMAAYDTDAVVAWLTPAHASDAASARPAPPLHGLALVQKNKQFSPHLLIVPTGSSVEFPNMDPFFHNVFSLFDGRRFDLGLYEAGSHRSVRFDHDGVSYIFCNIHPEMAAVVVSLNSPWYSVSSADGTIRLTNVPPGEYDLNLWSQNVASSDTAMARRRLRVGAEDLQLAGIKLKRTEAPLNKHLNKFGEVYKAPDQGPY